MKRRYLFIFLSFVVALGTLPYGAATAECATLENCMPMPGGGHPAGPAAHRCLNSPIDMQAASHSCSMHHPLEQPFQPLLVKPDSKDREISALELFAAAENHIPLLHHAAISHGLNKTGISLTMPVYLHTLALLI